MWFFITKSVDKTYINTTNFSSSAKKWQRLKEGITRRAKFFWPKEMFLEDNPQNHLQCKSLIIWRCPISIKISYTTYLTEAQQLWGWNLQELHFCSHHSSSQHGWWFSSLSLSSDQKPATFPIQICTRMFKFSERNFELKMNNYSFVNAFSARANKGGRFYV